MSDPRDDDLDPRINPSRQISLTRPPRLASDLARYYPSYDDEQEIIKRAMRDQLEQHDQGLTPTDLLATFRTFVAGASGQLEATIEGDELVVRCLETNSMLVLGSEMMTADVGDED